MGAFKVGLNAFCIVILLQAYGEQVLGCGSLNVVVPLNLIGSGIIRRYDFAGVE